MVKTLESHLKSVVSLIQKNFFQGDISGVVIGTTGSKPYDEESVASLIRKLGGIIHNDPMQGGKPKYIVVGREDFDKDYLQEVIENEASVLFFNQESFLGYILFGTDTGGIYETEEIADHPGLSCIDGLGGLPQKKHYSFGVDKSNSSHLEPQSFLRKKYGYHTNMLPSNRKECLKKAVHGEGIDAVTDHISWLIRMNRENSKIKDALNIWARDLDWLKNTYQ